MAPLLVAATSRNLCTLHDTLESGRPPNRISLDMENSNAIQTETLSVYQVVNGQEQRLWFATAKVDIAGTQPGEFFGQVFTYRPNRSSQAHLVYVAMRCNADLTCAPYTVFIDAVVNGVFGQVYRIDTNSVAGVGVEDGELIVVSPDGTVRWDVSWTGSSYFTSRER